MLGWVLGAVAATYGGGALYAFLRRDLHWAPYPSPEQAARGVAAELARGYGRDPTVTALLEQTGGEPCTAAFPEMAAAVEDGR